MSYLNEDDTSGFFAHASGNYEFNDWQRVDDYRIKAGGSSGGVMFLKYKDENDSYKLLVVKQSTGLDYFSFLAAKKCGLKSPNCRLVEYGSTEYEHLKRVMKGLRHQSDTIWIYRLFEKSFFMVMEMCAGRDLYNLASDGELPKMLSLDENNKNSILFAMGYIIAVDVTLNNWDRFPVIWENEGNFDNILIDSNGVIYSIDHTSTPLASNSPGYENYVKTVQKLFASLLDNPVKDTALQKLQWIVRDYLGFDIKQKGLLEIRSGLVFGVKKCLDVGVEGFKELIDLICNYKIENDKHSNIWKNNVGSLNLELINEIISIYENFVNKLNERKLNSVIDDIYESPVVVSFFKKIDFEDDHFCDKCEEIIENLKEKPNILVFPEKAFGNGKPIVLNESSAIVKKLGMLLAKHAIYAFIGNVLEKDGETNFESSLIINSDGTPIAKYRSRFPNQYAKELKVQAGSRPCVIETKYGRLGFLTKSELSYQDNIVKMKDLMTKLIISPCFETENFEILRNHCETWVNTCLKNTVQSVEETNFASRQCICYKVYL